MSIYKVNGKRNILLLVFLIALIELGGFISGFLSNSASNQYMGLVKPAFSPPGWVFPVVWTILYFLMAVALYRVLLWGSKGKVIGKAVLYFIIQLILNYLWTIIFFRLNLYGIALLELLLLLLFIIMTTIEFCKIDKKAAWLMIPYILWVSFAAVLNYYFWILNR
ncbi:MAG: TspO and like protein [Clostridia bacterium]|jgi:tryptophan-rich sensory protein|nr:TspO and like protein [Clostridia bacterium]